MNVGAAKPAAPQPEFDATGRWLDWSPATVARLDAELTRYAEERAARRRPIARLLCLRAGVASAAVMSIMIAPWTAVIALPAKFVVGHALDIYIAYLAKKGVETKLALAPHK